MKVRNGFVSNSSSSSFVIIGVPVDEETEKKLAKIICEKEGLNLEDYQEDDYAELFYEHAEHALDCNYVYIEGADGVDNLMGHVLTDASDEDGGIDNFSLSLEEFQREIKEVAEKLQTPEEKVKLYAGTRPC